MMKAQLGFRIQAAQQDCSINRTIRSGRFLVAQRLLAALPTAGQPHSKK
jgi:hypothetical protein